MPAATLESIEEQLLRLASAERTRWQEVSRLLLRVEGQALWRQHANSFTSWLDGVAAQAGLQTSGLWRSLKAGRIYLDLVDATDPELLEDLPVTAESLELADKIKRHAPAAVAKHVVRRTLDGDMRLAELRETWRIYRPASAGLTARGRLPSDPDKRKQVLQDRTQRWSAAQRKPEVKAAVAASEVLHALSDFDWLGSYDQAELEADVSVGDQRVDAAVVVRRSVERKAELQLHGVRIAGSAEHLRGINLKTLKSAFDYLWLATTSTCEDAALSAMPAHVGIVVLQRGSLSVSREAHRQRPGANDREAWLSTLLSRSYRWPGV